MSKLVISSATGPADATRASIPFHIAVNGAAASNVDAALVLAGDATELLKPGAVAEVRGLGVPPLAELIEKCRAAGVVIHV